MKLFLACDYFFTSTLHHYCVHRERGKNGMKFKLKTSIDIPHKGTIIVGNVVILTSHISYNNSKDINNVDFLHTCVKIVKTSILGWGHFPIYF